MKENMHYISLTIKGGNAYHQDGKRLKMAERIVNIGESADCDVRYETDCVQPEYYASIIRNDDNSGWRIVKRSQHTDINIVGKGSIGYAYQLVDGDIIHFSNQQMALSFHSHFDDKYDEVGQNRTWQWAVAGLVGLAAIIAIILNFGNRQDGILAKDIEPLEESVYIIKVDSVRQMLITNSHEELLTPTKVLEDDAPTGTAFLTTDGKLVTARHCVEYWIGTNLDLTTKVADMKKDDIVRWAIETETFNQIHNSDSMMCLQVFFSIFDFMGNIKYSFASTDERVHINKEKDGLFLLADFSQDFTQLLMIVFDSSPI